MAPAQPFDYSFMDEDFNKLYTVEQRTGRIFITFAVLAILIASLGEIVDSAPVVAALDAGKLRANVTDFPKRALLDHPKAICFPHLGASTVQAEETCAVMVADNVRESSRTAT